MFSRSKFFSLSPINKEQSKIIKDFRNNNVVVRAVAGSGKTTAAVQMMKEYSNDKILALSYSSQLKNEMRNKVNQCNIKNTQVHSFHSLGLHYKKSCKSDIELEEILDSYRKPIKDIEFDRLIIDEAQDMSDLYVRIIRKILQDNIKKKFYIALFGDQRQCIYEFKGANIDFFMNPSNYFGNGNWIEEKLSYSFRITRGMMNIINKGFYNDNTVIQSLKKLDNDVHFYSYDIWDQSNNNKVLSILKEVFSLGYSPSDIFISSFSVRPSRGNWTPITIIENIISRNYNFPIYINQGNRCGKTLEEAMKGKLVITSIHGTKGLERKINIVLGIDQNIMKFIRNDTCPNLLYVAMTRASHKLYLLKCKNNKYHLPYVNQEYIFNKIPKNINWEPTPIKLKSFIDSCEIYENITELCRNTRELNIPYTVISNKRDKINIPTRVDQDGYIEEISNITGNVIPIFLEQKIRDKVQYLESISFYINNPIKDKVKDFPIHSNYIYDNKRSINDLIYTLSDKNKNLYKFSTIEEIVTFVIEWEAFTLGYSHQKKQIKIRDWITKDHLIQVWKYASQLNMIPEGQFERPRSDLFYLNGLTIHLNGNVDYEDDEKVIEFKCVDRINTDHLIQTVMYKGLDSKNRDYYIINLLNGEIFKINCTVKQCRKIIYEVLENKYEN